MIMDQWFLSVYVFVSPKLCLFCSMAPCNKVGEFLDGEANRIAKERSLEEAVMFLAQWRTQDFC